ncbi:MAG: hypothetical protein K8R76_07860 [Candidatus Aegiribacteria sp.]|nr:hypothetical protein [Candidatus Aegiribacteria sp.]
MKKCLLFIMLGTVLPGGLIRQVSAQEVLEQKPAESEYWINGGFGPAKPDYGFGLTGSYRTGLHIFSARFLYSTEVAILSDSREFLEGAILSGLAWSTTYGLISLETGIGFVGGSWDLSGQSEIESFTTIGLPVAVQLFWTPTEKLGIGLYGYANFNSQEHMGGLLICLQLINFAG